MLDLDEHLTFFRDMLILCDLFYIVDWTCRDALCEHFIHNLFYRVLRTPLFDVFFLDLVVLHAERNSQETLVCDHPRHPDDLVAEFLIKLLVTAADHNHAILRLISIIWCNGCIGIAVSHRELPGIEVADIRVL